MAINHTNNEKQEAQSFVTEVKTVLQLHTHLIDDDSEFGKNSFSRLKDDQKQKDDRT